MGSHERPPAANIQPSLDAVEKILNKFPENGPNIVPLCASLPADLLTPTLAYLKISDGGKPGFSFLFESAATTETIGRYSFVGANPTKVLKTGPGHGPAEDPLPILAQELAQYREASIPSLKLPSMMGGGAIGYVGYDCVRYFEPKTARPLEDVLKVPESLFMIFDTIVAFDHFFQVIKIISYLHVPSTATDLPQVYSSTAATIQSTIETLLSPGIPLPQQSPILPNQNYTSNIGRAGYESHVTTLKKHISRGDIIQAVPSQRFARPTTLHPFNIYRHLRTVNPSPYLFYLSCSDFSIVGASPELLVKLEPSIPPPIDPSIHSSTAPTSPASTSPPPKRSRIITHPIAGTVKRGPDAAADAALATALSNSIKDRAEHVMLVDLARNDVNRVCDPFTTRVDRLMTVQKFSHVQHLVSEVSGELRPGKTRFDAFRSIFPAGTVSGAPKVRAMELIAELEQEKRGVYAGAVGYFGYGSVSFDEKADGGKGKVVEEEGAMDTCIALRTMLVKDSVAYLQAGGGIVFDSDEYDEWVETMNKLGANMQCIEGAEERYGGGGGGSGGSDWKARVEGWEGGLGGAKTAGGN
ncbi:hypothetical protein MMC10_006071 [Thelotrema lepadinum]|nr:hypothetical protein [Thelotrema lepadinum]